MPQTPPTKTIAIRCEPINSPKKKTKADMSRIDDIRAVTIKATVALSDDIALRLSIAI